MMEPRAPDNDDSSEIYSGQMRRLSSEDVELLKMMEEMNRANEQDTRTVVSGSSGRGTGSVSISSSDSGGPPDDSSSTAIDNSDSLCAWSDLVQNWVDEFNHRPEYIRILTRRGIPSQFRSTVWPLLSKADVESARHLYSKYSSSASPLLDNRLNRLISRCRIHPSLGRINQSSSSSIFDLSKVYTLMHDRIPSQSTIHLLHVLLSEMPDGVEALAVLLRLMDSELVGGLYHPSSMTTVLSRLLYQFDCLLRSTNPDLHWHLTRKIEFDLTEYASSWFLTFYAPRLCAELANRILDVFIVEGIGIVSRLAVAALVLCRRDLLLQSNAEGISRYLQLDLCQKLDHDHDLFINTGFDVKMDPEPEDTTTAGKVGGCEGAETEEDTLELAKLRIINSLLRQRITRLEDEGTFLVDELMPTTTTKGAHDESNVDNESSTNVENGSENLKSELLELRWRNEDVHKRLDEAYQTIKELTCTASEGREDKEVQADDQPTIEHIHVLQEQVIEARARDLDYVNVTKELRIRAREHDLANEKLKSEPYSNEECLSSLRNELTEIKTRESDANQLLSDTRRKIKALHEDWEHFVSKQPPADPQSSVVTAEEIHQQIMGALIREADALAELKESSQRVMELETQNHVFGNQLRRQDDEYKKLQSDVDAWPRNERDVQCSIREAQHKLKDVEARITEESVLARLREAELHETIADLKTQLSNMESSYFEKWTQGELNKSGIPNHTFDDDDDDEYEEDEEDDTETLEDGIDSSYHSGEVTTEDDFEGTTSRRSTLKSTTLDSKHCRYEVNDKVLAKKLAHA